MLIFNHCTALGEVLAPGCQGGTQQCPRQHLRVPVWSGGSSWFGLAGSGSAAPAPQGWLRC